MYTEIQISIAHMYMSIYVGIKAHMYFSVCSL